MAKPKVDERENQPSYRAAAVAAGLVFILYVITLAPSTAMWDTSEYISAAYVLGIPHPPGNPLFVLLGHVVSLLPIAPSVAQRINLMAAFCSAVSAGMWFLITERVLEGWLPERLAADGRGLARGARGRHGIHGLEPVGREREGLHGLTAVLRGGRVAHRALVR